MILDWLDCPLLVLSYIFVCMFGRRNVCRLKCISMIMIISWVTIDQHHNQLFMTPFSCRRHLNEWMYGCSRWWFLWAVYPYPHHALDMYYYSCHPLWSKSSFFSSDCHFILFCFYSLCALSSITFLSLQRLNVCSLYWVCRCIEFVLHCIYSPVSLVAITFPTGSLGRNFISLLLCFISHQESRRSQFSVIVILVNLISLLIKCIISPLDHRIPSAVEFNSTDPVIVKKEYNDRIRAKSHSLNLIPWVLLLLMIKKSCQKHDTEQ